jgi:hypothetical protein
MSEVLDGPLHEVGRLGEAVPGPPWLLGARGLAAAAPENTLAALEAAVELGLDGVSYEARACASGELVLLADANLDRTTDSHGPVATRTLVELASIDAGSWFHRRFSGERIALLEEALESMEPRGSGAGSPAIHVIQLAAPNLAAEVARVLEGGDPRRTLRIASQSRETCLELRDLGLQSMLLVARATSEVQAFVRDERIPAVGILSGPWRGDAALEVWPSERWALCVDDPEDLLECARRPLTGVGTREGLRALAARALARFAPHDTSGWPISPIELEVPNAPSPAGPAPGRGGEWAGAWQVSARVRNPFGWPVRALVGLCVRRGAFDVEGLPVGLELGPGESAQVPLRLRGGSFSPGGDPLLLLALRWQRGPGRPEERLCFDAPLTRVRYARQSSGTQRLFLLRERPGDPPASVTLASRRGALEVSIEDRGGLADAELLVHLDGVVRRGGQRLRLELPPVPQGSSGGRPGGGPGGSGGTTARGLAFSVAVAGRAGGELRLRRWAGGLPDTWEGGAPGRLFLERNS